MKTSINLKNMRILLSMLFVFLSVNAVAQNITGTVKDNLGEPAIGASVVEKGTSNGTITDVDGKFTLKVSGKYPIEVSYIGYMTQVINLKGKTSLNIILQEIDEGSGFCFGVVTAINKAEEELANGGTLYCLGDIVHNSREVERLKEMGLITINHDDFNHLHDAKVLLRAHGEPPETYEIARRNNIEIIDATCPVVLRLQKKIKQEYTQKDTEDKQIVIYGKTGHAEVLGLVGQTTGEAIVIEKLEEAKKLDFTRSIRLYSQTTKSLDEFQKIVEYIKEHISPDVTFEYYDTICRQVANRIPNIRKFAASHDLVFFVSGKKSSNGKMLFSECKKVNPNSHLIDSAEEIDSSLLTGASSIGVCGATSTPKWLMEEISKAIQSRLTGQ